jgi:hypothetical protein
VYCPISSQEESVQGVENEQEPKKSSVWEASKGRLSKLLIFLPLLSWMSDNLKITSPFSTHSTSRKNP